MRAASSVAAVSFSLSVAQSEPPEGSTMRCVLYVPMRRLPAACAGGAASRPTSSAIGESACRILVPWECLIPHRLLRTPRERLYVRAEFARPSPFVLESYVRQGGPAR